MTDSSTYGAEIHYVRLPASKHIKFAKMWNSYFNTSFVPVGYRLSALAVRFDAKCTPRAAKWVGVGQPFGVFSFISFSEISLSDLFLTFFWLFSSFRKRLDYNRSELRLKLIEKTDYDCRGCCQNSTEIGSQTGTSFVLVNLPPRPKREA